MQISKWSIQLLALATAASTMAVSQKPADAREFHRYSYQPYGYNYHGPRNFAMGTAIGAELGMFGAALRGEPYPYPGYYPSYPEYPYPVYSYAPPPPVRVYSYPVPY